MADEVLTLPAALTQLEKTAPPGGVLSAYVDTSPGATLGRASLIAFINRRKELQAETPPADHVELEAAAGAIERYLRTHAPNGPGLAVFAAADPTYFHAVPLPAPPVEQLVWGPRPAVGPLARALDDCERVAILLFDKERARLLTVFLDTIEERHALFDEVPGKQATGDWFALSQTRYARHHEEHVRRHAERAVAALTRELRAHPFDRLFVAGPDEAIAQLDAELTRPLRARLVGRLDLELFASDADVRRAVVAAAATIERQEEERAVRALLDAASTARAVLGLSATLAALNDGLIHRLFVAGPLAGTVGVCPTCDRLMPGTGPCPTCDSTLTPVADALEATVERALATGARVEFVSGPGATLLMDHDGIGAWTRRRS